MVNARQTPILASPSANIAGSQTNRFITASYVPLGAGAQGSGSFGKWRTGAEARASACAARRAAAGWRQPPRSTVPSLSRYVSTRSASSKRRKLDILIWLLERKDPIRSQATASRVALSDQMLTAPPTEVGLGQEQPVPVFQQLAGDRPPGRDDVCGPHGRASRRSSLARRTERESQPKHRIAGRARRQNRPLGPATISLAFLCPALVKAVIDGRLPRGFEVKRLMDLPMAWPDRQPSQMS